MEFLLNIVATWLFKAVSTSLLCMCKAVPRASPRNCWCGKMDQGKKTRRHPKPSQFAGWRHGQWFSYKEIQSWRGNTLQPKNFTSYQHGGLFTWPAACKAVALGKEFPKLKKTKTRSSMGATLFHGHKKFQAMGATEICKHGVGGPRHYCKHTQTAKNNHLMNKLKRGKHAVLTT